MKAKSGGLGKPGRAHGRPGHVPLNRALSKLGILSRSEATAAIAAGRVRVNNRIVRDPLAPIVPERIRVTLDEDEEPRAPAEWRAILLHKPRGSVTTRRNPDGRPTVFDVVGDSGDGTRGLVAVGRLDLATSGLLLLTSDTRLAAWITDPANAVPRIYIVTVRGRVTEQAAAALTAPKGMGDMRAHAVTLRKASSRESHLTVELREGRNREVRRLFAAIGHEVTRLKRVAVGGLDLGDLEPGQWRELSRDEVAAAFGCTDLIAGAPGARNREV